MRKGLEKKEEVMRNLGWFYDKDIKEGIKKVMCSQWTWYIRLCGKIKLSWNAEHGKRIKRAAQRRCLQWRGEQYEAKKSVMIAKAEVAEGMRKTKAKDDERQRED